MHQSWLSKFLFFSFSIAIISCTSQAGQKAEREEVIYLGSPSSAIASGVIVPADKKYYWSSGATGPVVDSLAEDGSRARFGDTQTQAIGILKKFQENLAESSLSLKDVTYLRVYLTPDKETGEIDYKGWYEAYGQFFGTEDNPTKPSRATLGIAGLANPNKFIEIELVAVFP